MLTEVYKPTPDDIEKIRPRDGFLKVSGDGIFATQQGEGITAGMRAIFLRLHWCNLACGRNGGWMCDTWYTWDKRTAEFWQEPKDIEPSEAAKEIAQAWYKEFDDLNNKRVVITGGEPLLQQRKLVDLISHLPGWAVEIETNGTLAPITELWDHQFNCSPKLSNSGNTRDRRYRPEILKRIAVLHNSWFKFVVMNVEDLTEVEEIVNNCGIPTGRVLIMPEGQTAENVKIHTDDISNEVAKNSWLMTLRNQLIWYGSKRRT